MSALAPFSFRSVNKKAFWVLIVLALINSIAVIHVFLNSLDGPLYTHRMWFEDRMDRINEDQKLRDLINLRTSDIEQKLNEHIQQHVGSR